MNVEKAPAPTSVLTRLRAETRAEHDAIENVLDLTSESLTLDAYRRILERFYGFYKPLEAGLLNVGGWKERGLDLAERRKTHLLETDLHYFGVNDLDKLPICTDLPPHGTVAAAFGCMYVLEGSTLGGQIISQKIRNHLSVFPDTGGMFFHGYASGTFPMWQAFRASIASCVKSCDEDEVVFAAKETFLKLHQWISSRGDNR